MRKAAFAIGVALMFILWPGGAVLGQTPEQGPPGFFPRGMGEGGFGGAFGEPHMGRRLLALLDNDRAKAALNLTDQQVDRLRQILVDAEKAGVKLRADMALRGIELRELLRADKPDHDAVMSKVRELSDLRGQMMAQHVEGLLAAKTVLTPEQQKRIHSFLENPAAFGGMSGRMRMQREGGRVRQPEAAPRPPTPLVPPANPDEPPVL